MSSYQTISIILYDTFLCVSNNWNLKLNIDEVTMFVNADDQNIFSKQCANISAEETNKFHAEDDDYDENEALFHPPGGTCDIDSREDCLINGSDEYPQPNKRRFFYAKNLMMSIVGQDPTLMYERNSLGTKAKLNTLLKLNFDLFKVRY